LHYSVRYLKVAFGPAPGIAPWVNTTTSFMRKPHFFKTLPAMIRIGIDTGGTFTDFILFSPDGIRTHKVPSTPADPCMAIMEGLGHLLGIAAPTEIFHGTTVGTNAFLERKGAKTLLLTTRGFEDVLLIGRQNRSSIYDLNLQRPRPFIGPERIIGINERMRADGSIRKKLSATVGKRLRKMCRELHIESVAICLLHSYANDAHEKKLESELAGLSIPITRSSEILPEFREYERLCTTGINAYLAPVIADYIKKLQHHFGSLRLFIQQSNGGILPAAGIDLRAVQTILSGPAGGVQGAFSLAGGMHLKKIITFDMGGTSTDVSLCDGALTLTREYSIDGFPLRNQVIDINTVGAGGGSIAWIYGGGLLQVGPHSAGANPGPVCYGRGDQITVTDANLFLGRMPDRLLGGEMVLDRQRSLQYLERLAARLSLSPLQCALGIIRIVNAGMVKAVRAVSVERGHNPKDFTLFSFGGASGLHCCELAEELGIKKIIVPARAGILSAQGMVLSDPSLDFTHTFFLGAPSPDHPALLGAFDELEGRARKQAAELGLRETVIEKSLDLRYRGQSYELTLAFNRNFIESFHNRHRQLFGYNLEDTAMELVCIRLTIRSMLAKPELPTLPLTSAVSPIAEQKSLICRPDGKPRLTEVYRRPSLLPGQHLNGPALIVDDFTTIFITENFSLFVDGQLNLRLDRHSARLEGG
jgi:N-methylhydantoinase A